MRENASAGRNEELGARSVGRQEGPLTENKHNERFELEQEEVRGAKGLLPIS